MEISETMVLGDLEPFRLNNQRLIRNQSGSCAEVLIMPEENCVVKIPRADFRATARDTILFEALIAQKAHEALQGSRFQVPRVLECGISETTPVPYAVLSLIPGDTLSPEVIEASFSTRELEELGSATAEFVHEFAQAVSFTEYQAIRRETPHASVSDRA